MDLATLVGLVTSFIIMFAAMALGGDMMMYLDVPSLLIVVVGSLFVVMAKYELEQYFNAVRVAAKAFFFRLPKPDHIIEEISGLAGVSRKGGILALEGQKVSDPFLARGLQLLVDGFDQDVVRTLLTKDMKQTIERHNLGISIFRAIGDVAPSMGMMGTLVGLVAMLGNMNDPKSIGPAMATALITTLYGAMMSTMFALPIADKLSLRRDEESRLKAMIIDGLMAIQTGQNPRVIASVLQTYLQPSKRLADV